MGMLYEQDWDAEAEERNDRPPLDAEWHGFEMPDGDAHPPLEPATGEHFVVCAECGDAMGLCPCVLTVTDHTEDGQMCTECTDEALNAY